MDDLEGAVEANNRRVSLRSLYLDPNNYRIIHEEDQVDVPEEDAKDRIVAQRTLRLLAGEKNQHIQDLIESFKANGYLPVDQIQVKEISSGGYVVVEGNRRIAALKLLQQDFIQKGVGLGKLDPEIFSRIPVILYADADEMHHLTLMALKHISGNKKWGEWNQAKLLEKMHENGLDEADICRRIGITKVELRRSLRALSLVEQFRRSDYGDQFTESKFPIFRQAVRNSSFKKWIEWDESTGIATNSTNRDLFFSLLSREPIEEEDEEGYSGFGQKYLEPAITKRDDIDILGKIVSDDRALEQLKLSRDLNAAYRASDLVFRERQDSAIKSISADISTLTQLAIRGESLPELEGALGRLQTIVERTKSSGLGGVEQKAVFHDRIDEHLTMLEIGEYRGIRNLKLDKLSRINLFAGINNSGKTSLLEAILLLARQNDFAGLIDVMRRRGKVAADQLDPEWLLEQLGGNIIISGVFDKNATKIQIEHYEENDPQLDKSRYIQSVEISSSYGQFANESITRVFKGRDRETQADSIKLLCLAIFSSPFFLNEPHRYTAYYHRSTQSKSLGKIFDFLRRAILPTLKDIRLTDERQRFLVDDERFSEGIDLSAYGEGLQRIFFISLLFASCQNGILLIDEFENAIHIDLIKEFVPFVVELAVEFNVQLFVTSHSKECIDAFVASIVSPEEFSFHAIVKDGDRIVSRDFAGVEYRKLVKAGNVDLRRAG